MDIKYIKSAAIEVFPSANRDSTYIAAKRMSEENLTSRRISDNPANANYCFETGGDIELYLIGYRFKFPKTALLDALDVNTLPSTVYAFINTANPDDNYAGNVLDKVLINATTEISTFSPQANIEAAVVGKLDIDSEFCGLGFSTTEPPDDTFTATLAMQFDNSGNLSSNTLTIDAANVRTSDDADTNITEQFTTANVDATNMITIGSGVNSHEITSTDTELIIKNKGASTNDDTNDDRSLTLNLSGTHIIKLDGGELGNSGIIHNSGILENAGTIQNVGNIGIDGDGNLAIKDNSSSNPVTTFAVSKDGLIQTGGGKIKVSGGEIEIKKVSESDSEYLREPGYPDNTQLLLSDINIDPNTNKSSTRLSAGLTGSDNARVVNTSVQLLYPKNDTENDALCLPETPDPSTNKDKIWMVSTDDKGKATNKWINVGDDLEVTDGGDLKLADNIEVNRLEVHNNLSKELSNTYPIAIVNKIPRGQVSEGADPIYLRGIAFYNDDDANVNESLDKFDKTSSNLISINAMSYPDNIFPDNTLAGIDIYLYNKSSDSGPYIHPHLRFNAGSAEQSVLQSTSTGFEISSSKSYKPNSLVDLEFRAGENVAKITYDKDNSAFTFDKPLRIANSINIINNDITADPNKTGIIKYEAVVTTDTSTNKKDGYFNFNKDIILAAGCKVKVPVLPKSEGFIEYYSLESDGIHVGDDTVLYDCDTSGTLAIKAQNHSSVNLQFYNVNGNDCGRIYNRTDSIEFTKNIKSYLKVISFSGGVLNLSYI